MPAPVSEPLHWSESVLLTLSLLFEGLVREMVGLVVSSETVKV